MLLIEGLSELQKDLQKLADKTGEDSAEYRRVAKKVLTAGAEPMRDKMLDQASKDPKIITQTLYNAIKIGVFRRSKTGNAFHIDVGAYVPKELDAFYARFVEFGHGGPAPAPPHPFVRPAFDAKADESYAAMRQTLDNELFR